MGKVLAAKVTKNTFGETIGEQDSYRQTFSLWVGSGSDLRPSQFVIQWVIIGHVCRSVRHGCKQVYTTKKSVDWPGLNTRLTGSSGNSNPNYLNLSQLKEGKGCVLRYRENVYSSF